MVLTMLKKLTLILSLLLITSIIYSKNSAPDEKVTVKDTVKYLEDITIVATRYA